MLDVADEDSVTCAARELLEETGYRTSRPLEPLGSILTTPGFTDEMIHLFWATGLTLGSAAREPDEFIEVVPRPLSQVLSGIRDGEVRDAKTVAALRTKWTGRPITVDE